MSNSRSDAEWVAIQANPMSGAGTRREQIRHLVDALRVHHLRPLVFRSRERLSQVLENPDFAARLRCIVAAGGDGTVGDVINRFPGRRLAILPLGTENLLARYLKIPCCGRRVGDLIAEGNSRTIDLAAVGERRFSLMASIGFDADVVHRLHAVRTGHVRRATYIKPIWESLRRYRYPDIRLWLDGEPEPHVVKLAMIVNLNAYALGIQPAVSARDNDGLLDVRLFERGSAFQMWRYFYNVMRGTHESLRDVRKLQAARIRVEADRPVAVQVDGDPAGMTPVEVRVLPGALEVMVTVENLSSSETTLEQSTGIT